MSESTQEAEDSVETISTNAFCRKTKAGITLELCIYCGACVLSCIVDDCIKIVRKRSTGGVGSFRVPTEVLLQHIITVQEHFERVQDIFPKLGSYLKR